MTWTEDRFEILDLIASYAHAADGTVPEAYADCFTDDGEFHGRVGLPDAVRIQGRAALIRFSANGIARRNGVQNRHIQTNTMFVEQSETRAVTRSYLLVTQIREDQPPTLGLTSVYEDEIVKTAKGWRFKVRRAIPDRKGTLRPQAATP